MTDSIARFQREAAQRERLSSLGRLSTVVAHEIRNPLMIIRTALRRLKQGTGQPGGRARPPSPTSTKRSTRLNRIVSEVLDFARPIKFDLEPVDVNALCEDAVRAAGTEAPAMPVTLDLDRSLPPVVTDGERLRLALVNILTNARHAVLAHARRGSSANAGHPCRDHPRRRVDGWRSRSAIRAWALPRKTSGASSIRISPPGAPEPGSAWRFRGISSKDLAERSAYRAAPGQGTEVRIELPGHPAETRLTLAQRSRTQSTQAEPFERCTGSILLVDDETKILNALAPALRGEGHEVVATASAREAQRLLGQRLFDVLVVDNLMPELTGTDLIRELVGSTTPGERPQILMMTAHATVESAIEAMKLGALDYLQKPFEVDELLVVVNRALDHQRLSTEHRYLISERDAEFNHYGIVGRSRRMQEVIRTAQVVARSKSTILITGETGTGKEMVARAIHYPQRPAGNAAHQGELRGDSGDAARVGAVRPRARRVHRARRRTRKASSRSPTAARSSSTRSAR